MFKPLKHPNVRILEGHTALIGKTGVIVDKVGRQYRVNLDTPVEVPGVGLVAADLWMPAALKVLKSAPKPVVTTDAVPIPARPQTQLADAEQALAEAAAGEQAAEPAPQPAPAADRPEAGIAGKPPARKPKALSAKQGAQQRDRVKVTGERPKAKGDRGATIKR